ncbi:hypothetical protein CBS147321_5212 [Aspergillus niger]|nr:hypothetical protein CBS133816_7202 [Aspergillus niger]KAI2863029.1 hypothetical protein CBS12448_4242 [Aspergillus niger]KAI2922668.1 hypothetical protein CBS147320_7223 [Aspergillus niger]KAI2942619.1 hypothetical protein CBS147321_5212 [Aspergillus niger]KAI2966321.1 hypothetical protein CBS147324_7520 [Aspergillus niger]
MTDGVILRLRLHHLTGSFKGNVFPLTPLKGGKKKTSSRPYYKSGNTCYTHNIQDPRLRLACPFFFYFVSLSVASLALYLSPCLSFPSLSDSFPSAFFAIES